MSETAFDHGPPAASVFERLQKRLEDAGITFSVMHHQPVRTSEEAAAVRGTSLASGAKALLLNLDGTVALFVLPANRRLASRKVRTTLSVKNVRFATTDEVLELTGLRPGSIPPFGSLFGLPTYCDPALKENETINFNAGDQAISIALPFRSFQAVEAPTMLDFSEPPS
jgi:Ala-tRNA(Pro) deacylase